MEKYWSRFADDFNARQTSVVGCDCIEAVRKKLSLQNDLGRVLEFGCGNRGYTKFILDNAEHITATDYSKEMIEQLQKVFNGNPKVTIEQADCHKTRFPDSSFDTVFMANVIHVIDMPDLVIKESRRVLKPHGKVIITSFTTEKMGYSIRLVFCLATGKRSGLFPKAERHSQFDHLQSY